MEGGGIVDYWAANSAEGKSYDLTEHGSFQLSHLSFKAGCRDSSILSLFYHESVA